MGQLFCRTRRDDNVSDQVSRGDGETESDDVVQRFSRHSGPFFGSHFLMGGERYEVAKPEAFLFGEVSDLDFLDGKAAKFPYGNQPITDPVKTLNALINLRCDSVKLVKVTERNIEEMEEGKSYFNIEFCLDCDSACYVQIHFFATEIIRNGNIRFDYRYPDLHPSPQYFFDVGAEQHFDQYFISEDLFTKYNMHYESGPFFPVVIELRTVDCCVEQIQTTMASVKLSTDRNAGYVLKAMKQKLIADGVVYLLQEIYGIENKEHDLNDENCSECIICLSNIRDTVILPCRHLCLCNGCADTVRCKLSNCPICRSPFRALLQLKTMRVISTVSITNQSSSAQQTRSQMQYETMTLVEALNGPITHIQSCALPSVHVLPEQDSVQDSLPVVNRTLTRTPKNAGMVLASSGKESGDDGNAVYIEMMPTNRSDSQIDDIEQDNVAASDSLCEASVESAKEVEVEVSENPGNELCRVITLAKKNSTSSSR